MATAPSVELGYGVLLFVIAALSVRWAYRTITGTPVSFAAIVGMSVVYVLIFAYAALNSLRTLADLLLVPFVIVAAVAAVIAARYVEQVVRFEQRSDGRWYFRLGLFLPMLYIAILVSRLVENLILLRIDPFQVQLPPALPLGSLAARIVFTSNVLFAAGTGFLVGRNLGVHRAFVRLRARTAPARPGGSHPI